MNESARFWYFIRKVNERTTILLQHNVPNRIPLEEIDEQLYKEIYEWFSKSDLYSASDPIIHDNIADQLTILDNGINVDVTNAE